MHVSFFISISECYFAHLYMYMYVLWLLHTLQHIIFIHVCIHQVTDLQKTLVQWREQVDSLRQKYTWLLFFSVPKALYLFSLLDDDLDFNLPATVKEVSFLFENTAPVREILKKVVQVAKWAWSH